MVQLLIYDLEYCAKSVLECGRDFRIDITTIGGIFAESEGPL